MLKHFVTSLMVLAAWLGAAQSTAWALERRVALVIGNAQYRDAPLNNPVNDARDIAQALRRANFEVIEVLNATQKEMNRAIAKFGDRLNADAVALFYYAGHGMQVRGKNYLIPVDAQITNETSIRVESVDVDAVLDQLGNSELNVVILDACRNNPFERRFRSMNGGGLAQMDAPKGSLIAYATAPGKTAADGDGRNGLFTQELLRQIQVPGQTIEKVFKNVRREVARATRDNQIPWESSSLTGDFYFVPTASLPVGQPLAQVRPQARAEVPQLARQAASELLPAEKPATTAAEKPKTPEAPAATLAPEASKPAVVDAGPRERVIKAEDFTATGVLVIDPKSRGMTGQGVIEWTDGNRYEGSLLDGKKQGHGIFSWANGQRYEGEWADDLINGRGVLVYTNGDRYEGEFRNGEPHGKGTYTLQNGDIYAGAWVDGNKHGQGRLTWSNGDYWEGEFRHDRQTDNGRMVLGESPEKAGEDKLTAANATASKPVSAKKAR